MRDGIQRHFLTARSKRYDAERLAACLAPEAVISADGNFQRLGAVDSGSEPLPDQSVAGAA